jgi:hypothetical protein
MLQRLKKSVKACAAIDSLNASKLKTGQTSLGGHKGVIKSSILSFWPPKKSNSPNTEMPHSSIERLSQKECIGQEKYNGRRGTIDATVIGVDEPRKHLEPVPPLPATSVLERQKTHLLPRSRSLEVIKPSDILTKQSSIDHIIIMPPFDNEASIRALPHNDKSPIDNEESVRVPFSTKDNQDRAPFHKDCLYL